MEDSLFVLTSKSMNHLRRLGGTASWSLNPSRASEHELGSFVLSCSPQGQTLSTTRSRLRVSPNNSISRMG